MLIFLKCICFGLWFSMMLLLGLSRPGGVSGAGLFSLELHDPDMAEWQILKTLHRIRPDTRLKLSISRFNPSWTELLFIAACMCRKYPAVFIQLSGTDEKEKMKDPPFVCF